MRILARDGNLILSQTNPAANLAGPALFTTSTTPGQAVDGIFNWTGKGLNWDPYGHNPASADPLAKPTCTPDANGFNTGVAAIAAVNYYEWCQDHNKPLEAAPFGGVANGGPVTLPDVNILEKGAWYGGSPYLGPRRDRPRGRQSRVPLRHRAPLQTHPPKRPALRSCGTRTTSARSPPTIFSRAE